MKSKKLLTGILSAALVFSSLAFTAFADEEKGTQDNPYSLDEFNQLADVSGREIWVDAGDLDISQSSTTLGSYTMSDGYVWVKDGDTAPDGYVETPRKNAQNTATAYVSDKDGATIHLTGSIKSVSGAPDINSGFKSLYFQLPVKSTVILEGMTIDGVFDLNGNYVYLYNWPDGSLADGTGSEPNKAEWGTSIWYGYSLSVNKIEINNCTINGSWFHNGKSFRNVSIDNSTITSHNNTVAANNSNPIWWQNVTDMDSFSLTNSSVTTTRPIKFESGNADGLKVNVENNAFELLAGDLYTGKDADKVKSSAVYINLTNMGSSNISGNTLKAEDGVHTQLIVLKKAVLTDESKFVISNNKKADNTALALTELINGWKTEQNAEWTDDITDFVSDEKVELNSDENVFETMTDSGLYTVDTEKFGVMRFSFKASVTDEIKSVGIKFIKANNINASLKADDAQLTTSGNIASFYGDLTKINSGSTDKYYAAAYIITDGEPIWSDIVECTLDTNKTFTNYGGAQ